MNQEQRHAVRARAMMMHLAFNQLGDHDGQRLCEIVFAALDYAESTPAMRHPTLAALEEFMLGMEKDSE